MMGGRCANAVGRARFDCVLAERAWRVGDCDSVRPLLKCAGESVVATSFIRGSSSTMLSSGSRECGTGTMVRGVEAADAAADESILPRLLLRALARLLPRTLACALLAACTMDSWRSSSSMAGSGWEGGISASPSLSLSEDGCGR